MRYSHGFTLLELLISMAITLMVFAIVATVFLQMRKVSLRQEMDVAMIQEARLGVDEMARLIRMVGYDCDQKNEQPAIIEAAPFQFTFNADWDERTPLPKQSAIPFYDGINAYRSPDVDWVSPSGGTGAETIRLTLDSQNDGDVDAHDIGDNPEEQTSSNPDDMALMREVNGERNMALTIGALGPYKKTMPGKAEEKTYAVPMFQYYMALSPCAMMLLGDYDCDGELTGEERYFTPLTDAAQLRGVRRVRISVTTTSERKDPFDHSTYHNMTISTEVALRNPDKEGFFVPDPAEYTGCSFNLADCGCLPE